MEKLDIDSFKELPKEKFKDFIALFPQMDPELQKKALEQIPEFISSAKDYLTVLKENTFNSLSSEEKTTEAVIECCRMEIDALKEILKKDNITDDEKREILKAMNEIPNRLFEENARHRVFVDNLHKRSTEAGLATVALAAVAIGVKVVVPRVL